MAKGPRYRRPFRRRVEGKTNYHKRLKLIKSRKLRLVIRISSNHTRVQVVKSKIGGDEVLVSAFSKELVNDYGWNAHTGNIPAAYLTGYLAGKRAQEEGIKEAILDLGLFYHRNRVLSAFRGFLESEIFVPYREDFFPGGLENQIDGTHIQNYAKNLKQSDKEIYEETFSAYLQEKNLNPTKITNHFEKTLKKIDKNF
ncbi:MAG: 50S ribosomal protein L18 [Promethearchaeia archaeon]